jgi:putative inorganic carbon (HCO3(-)) transporter
MVGAGFALALLPLTWLAVGLCGAIVGALVLVKPHLALCLIAFAIPFGSLFEVNLGGITVGVTEGLVGLLLASWLARAIAFREKWTWPQLALPLALFIGATLLSLLNVTSLTFAAKEITKWIEGLAVMTFVANGLSRKQGKAVVACFLLAAVAQAGLGAYQFFTQSGPEFFVLRGRYLRAYGTFEQPNPYAGYLGLVAPLALAFGLVLLDRLVPTPRGAARHGIALPSPFYSLKGQWLNWLALVSFVAVAAAIGMSWSRGAWLGFAASFVVVNLIRSRRGAIALAVAVLVAATAGLLGGSSLFPASVVERLTSFLPFVGVQDVRALEITDQNYASVERLAHWQSALDMWADRPWVGVGFGNYEAAYPQYALPKWSLALGHAHNYYLNIAAEAGLIGLLSYLALWGTAFWQTLRSFRKATDPFVKTLALGALGMLVHVSVHNVVDNLWVHNMYIQAAITLGLVATSTRKKVQLT